MRIEEVSKRISEILPEALVLRTFSDGGPLLAGTNGRSLVFAEMNWGEDGLGEDLLKGYHDSLLASVKGVGREVKVVLVYLRPADERIKIGMVAFSKVHASPIRTNLIR